MSRNLKPVGIAACVLALGVVGFALLNPTVATSCKNSCSTSIDWVCQRAASAHAAFKRTKLYASYTRALNGHKNRVTQQKKKASALAAVTQQAPTLDMSPEAVRKREQTNWSIGQKIAHGPAFAQHAKEFGFRSEDQMAAHIDRVIDYATPSTTKVVPGGRTVYWDDRTHSVVVVEVDGDSGTMFKPNEGYPYFKDLKSVSVK